jgi:putative ABC transport system permease protein
MDPVVIVPSSTAESLAGRHPDAPLALLVILAEKPGYVAVLTEVIQSLLADADREFVTVETSAQFAAIRSAVAGELGQYGHETILGILAVSAFVVGVNLLALVMMRRKDFGRRRALGARRGMIIGLLLCQVGITAGLGALIGSVTTAAGLAAMGYSLPGAGYIGAVAVLAILSALAAAVPPALYAASRDPLHELRVPSGAGPPSTYGDPAGKEGPIEARCAEPFGSAHSVASEGSSAVRCGDSGCEPSASACARSNWSRSSR